jgi:hypothetical protein
LELNLNISVFIANGQKNKDSLVNKSLTDKKTKTVLLISRKYHGKVLVVKLYKRVKGIAGLEWVFLHPR